MRSAENPFRFDPVGKLMPSAEYDMRQTLPPQRPKTRYFLLRRMAPPVAAIDGESPGVGRGSAACASAAAVTATSGTAAAAGADSGSSSAITTGAAPCETESASQHTTNGSPTARGAAADDARGEAHSAVPEWVDLDLVTVHPFESQRCPDRQADGGLVVLAVRGARCSQTCPPNAPGKGRTAASVLQLACCLHGSEIVAWAGKGPYHKSSEHGSIL